MEIISIFMGPNGKDVWQEMKDYINCTYLPYKTPFSRHAFLFDDTEINLVDTGYSSDSFLIQSAIHLYRCGARSIFYIRFDKKVINLRRV